MKQVKDTPSCVYKKSCGHDHCPREYCKDYKPKKRGEPYFGEEKKEKTDEL